MCPSGQPIAPDASCPAAMVSPVVRMSCSVSTPATDGSAPATEWAYCTENADPTRAVCSGTGSNLRMPGRRPGGAERRAGRLARVHDQALADERVERPLRRLGQRRVLHDVPDQ